ncbi:hypothetical protein ANCDUO_16996, partial [Ancylostoma duodenale]
MFEVSLGFLFRGFNAWNDITLRVDFTAMQLTTVEHSFLFLFALMTYCKFELFFAINIVQLFFLAFKLDDLERHGQSVAVTN